MSDEREALEGQIADLLRAKTHSWAGPDKLAADIVDYVVAAGWRRSPAPACDGARPLPWDRDQLGRFVREAWVCWAQTQPNPKPSWLVPYDELSEPDKEADRQIGERVARWTLIGDAASGAAPAEDDAGLPAGAVVLEQADTSDGGIAQTYRTVDGEEHVRVVAPSGTAQPADAAAIANAVARAQVIVSQIDRGHGGQYSVVMEDMARALLAEHARAEAAERERDECRDKCMGCLTPDETIEAMNDLSRQVAAAEAALAEARPLLQESISLLAGMVATPQVRDLIQRIRRALEAGHGC